MTAADLRTWRRDQGLTRRQAGEALGVSSRSVEAWELGRKIPERTSRMICLLVQTSNYKEAEVILPSPAKAGDVKTV